MKNNVTQLRGLFNIVYANERTAVIDIDGDIGYQWWEEEPSKNTQEALKKQLRDIAAIKAVKIIVNINSYGGDINHGLSMHDLLKEHKAKKITRIFGMTASAATVVAAAGDVRQMSANALALIHTSRNGFYGTAQQQKENVKLLEKVDIRIADIYAKASGKLTSNQFLKLMKKAEGEGEWMDAKEMESTGLVTEIVEPMKVAANFKNTASFKDAKKYNLPEVPKNKIKSINNFKSKEMKNAGGDKKPKDKNKEKAKNSFFKDASNKLDSILAALKPGKNDVSKVENQISELKNDFQEAKAKNKKLKASLSKKTDELENTKAEVEKLQKKLAKAQGKPLATKKSKKGEDPKGEKKIDPRKEAELANQKALDFKPTPATKKK